MTNKKPEYYKKTLSSVQFKSATEESDLFHELMGTALNDQSQEKEKYAGPKRNPFRHITKKQKMRNIQPDAILDLHGDTREQALIKVERFLQNSKHYGCRSVLIITGRGNNSQVSEGKLKKTIFNWLENRQNEEGFRFRQAPGNLGGEGAILLFF